MVCVWLQTNVCKFIQVYPIKYISFILTYIEISNYNNFILVVMRVGMDQIVLNAFLYLDAKMENVSIIQIHVFVIQDGVATFVMSLIARKQDTMG